MSILVMSFATLLVEYADFFCIMLYVRWQNVDGVNYFHVKVVGLLFVATTRVNISPSFVFELLQRIARVIKDYLGILNEDSLRKNFVLVYELLDEVIVSFFSYPIWLLTSI
jgi:hypothetical protein